MAHTLDTLDRICLIMMSKEIEIGKSNFFGKIAKKAKNPTQPYTVVLQRGQRPDRVK
jgi:hypothetical protein